MQLSFFLILISFLQKGDTALTYAARLGHLNIVKELVSSGAKVDQTDRVSNKDTDIT